MEHITKHFGGVYAVDDVSFDLYAGEVLAVVGDNGAGKSTLIKILAGAHVADEGDIYVRGQRVTIETPRDARELGIETIYQNLALMNNLDIASNIFMGRELRTTPLLGRLGWMNLGAMASKSLELLRNFDIKVDDANRTVSRLSGGQRQMVAISRAIYFEAQIIIMDEPTAALGVAETRKVYDFIERLKDEGISVIIISHNINEVINVADRIMVLKTGKLVGIECKEKTTVDQIVAMIISGNVDTAPA
jgi:D-xylose transport system ATP-binding protein